MFIKTQQVKVQALKILSEPNIRQETLKETEQLDI